jgi:hypothetical protein
MTTPTPAEVIANALPPHALMGRIPLVDSNPCNGVGCGCHPLTEPETDRSAR